MEATTVGKKFPAGSEKQMEVRASLRIPGQGAVSQASKTSVGFLSRRGHQTRRIWWPQEASPPKEYGLTFQKVWPHPLLY